MILKQLKTGFLVFVLLTLLTGAIYPLTMTALAQKFFPSQANGSLIRQDGKVVGSSLIGQNFGDPKYLWGRPSATAPIPYNGSSSGGSNLGPLNPTLRNIIEARIKKLKNADPENITPVPVDLVTASASGLDPHVSPAAAFYQVPRVARLRKMPEGEVQKIIRRYTTARFLGLGGEPVVNVLLVNLELDRYGNKTKS